MKKTLFVVLLAVIAMVAAYGTAQAAAVTGLCSGCHTMHDSQNGLDQGDTGQQGNLLLNGCVSCHTSGGATAAPKIDGTADASGKDAGAFNTASGSVANADVTGDAQLHNVYELNTFSGEGVDGILADTPPGGVDMGSQLTCNGSATGCHGQGFHHTPTTVYRELNQATAGSESAIWEANGATTSQHNVYDASGADSISAFCASCHTNFHDSANTGSASPFTRHPTDEEAVISAVVATSFTPTNAQIEETPFGFASTAGMSTTTMASYGTATGLVTCISCHRAHASNQNDLLRFNYANISAGDSTNDAGCETCHVAQR